MYEFTPNILFGKHRRFDFHIEPPSIKRFRVFLQTIDRAAGETKIPTGITLGASGLTYCDETGRNTLINTYYWSISGDSKSSSSDCGKSALQTTEKDTKDPLTAEELKLYPNPARSRFQLLGLAYGTQLSMYDTNGRLIKIINS